MTTPRRSKIESFEYICFHIYFRDESFWGAYWACGYQIAPCKQWLHEFGWHQSGYFAEHRDEIDLDDEANASLFNEDPQYGDALELGASLAGDCYAV